MFSFQKKKNLEVLQELLTNQQINVWPQSDKTQKVSARTYMSLMQSIICQVGGLNGSH